MPELVVHASAAGVTLLVAPATASHYWPWPLATLSAQNVAPRAHRDTGSMIVRQQVVDCGTKSPTEVCLISYDSETSR